MEVKEDEMIESEAEEDEEGQGIHKISVVDVETRRLITSGQVMTDVATAVKELVENALDAGATAVDVMLTESGSDAIEVSDNGSGIRKEDFPRLVERYATSKLRSYSELSTVQSFGFRGEALASICEISGTFQVHTRHASSENGYLLEFNRDGSIKSESESARTLGTTISLKEIFKPFPVRQVDMKRNAKKHMRRCTQYLQQYALCAPKARLRLSITTNSRKTVPLAVQPGRSLLDTVRAIWGQRLASTLTELPEDSDQAWKIHGLVTKNRAQGVGKHETDRQLFFINHRPIESPTKLVRALNESWRTFELNHKPAAFLFIQLPGTDVDVNLAPDKRKAVIVDEARLVDTLKAALAKLWDREIQNSLDSGHAQNKKNIDSKLTKQQVLTQLFKPSLTHSKELVTNSKSDESSDDEDEAAPPPQPTHSLSRQYTTRSAAADHRKEVVASSTSDADSSEDESVPEESDPNSKKRGASSSIDNDQEPQEVTRVTRTRIFVENKASDSDDEDMDDALDAESENEKIDEVLDAESENEKIDEVLDAESENEDNESDRGSIVMTARERRSTRRRASSIHEDESEEPDDIEIQEEPAPRKQSTAPKTRAREIDLLEKTKRKRAKRFVSLPKDLPNDDEVEDDEEEVEEVVVAAVTQDRRANRTQREPEAEVPTTNDNRKQADSDDDDDDRVMTVTQGKPKERKPQRGPQVTPAREKEQVKEEEEITIPGHTQMRKFGSCEPDVKWEPPVTTEELVAIAHAQRKEREEKEKSMQKKKKVASTKKIDELITPIESVSTEDAEARLSQLLKQEDFKRMRVVGQFNKGFIITAIDGEVFVVDQHAADEKYKYEECWKNGVESQGLVAPLEFENAADELVALDNAELFGKHGFKLVIDHDAPVCKRARIVALPVAKGVQFGPQDARELVGLLGGRSSNEAMPRLPKLHTVFASKACRSSVMIGNALNRQQMHNILDNMSTMNHPWNCPHGRPTMRHLINTDALDEIARLQTAEYEKKARDEYYNEHSDSDSENSTCPIDADLFGGYENLPTFFLPASQRRYRNFKKEFLRKRAEKEANGEEDSDLDDDDKPMFDPKDLRFIPP